MPIPDYQSLMHPVLSAASHGEVRVREVVEKLAGELGLTPEERTALLGSGKETVFNNRVHWAKTYLRKAGLIEYTRRGHYKITPRGEQVIQARPEHIDNAFLDQFDEFKKFKQHSAQGPTTTEEVNQQPSKATIANPAATPDEIMRVAHRQIE